jgi:hypothetical protein
LVITPVYTSVGLRRKNMITIKLRSVGNPDHGQYAPVSERKTVQVQTIAEAQKACEDYIAENDLGGGNFVDPKVMEDGKHIGWISYNGRFWTCAERKASHGDRRFA